MEAIELLTMLGGAVLSWALLNDRQEFGIKGRAHWIVLLIALFVTKVVIDLDHIRALDAGLAMAAFTFFITYPERPSHEAPEPRWSVDPDHIERLLFFIHRAWRGRAKRAASLFMGFDLWLAWSAFRYALPCAVIAWALGQPLVALAGPLIIFCYWPLIPFLVSPKLVRDLRALAFGLVFFGVL